jgi:hypothetical protein
MILPPQSIRRLRSVVRKCLVRPSRPPGPSVLVHSDGQTLYLFADIGEIAVQLQVTHSTRKQRLTVPLSFLETLEGAGREPVEFHLPSATEGVARWNRDGVTVEHPFVPPSAPKPGTLALPSDWVPMPRHFLPAMYEAGRTAAKEATKYALNRIQLRGRSGSIVASDAKQGLIQSGFPFPFADDLYLPARPVFGLAEFHAGAEIGRTPNHLAIRTGEWTFWLATDSSARYPDVEQIVPRRATSTRLEFGASDVGWLLEHAKEFSSADSLVALTIDAGPERVLLRTRPGTQEGVEVRLASTRVDGPPVRFGLDGSHLERLLRLGFRSLEVAGAKQPVVARDGHRIYLAMVLGPESVVASARDLRRLSTAESDAVILPAVSSEPPTVKPDPAPRPDPPGEEALDPIAEAAALKAALWEAAQRASRLLAALRVGRKERRVLDQVFSSLKALNRGNRGEP